MRISQGFLQINMKGLSLKPAVQTVLRQVAVVKWKFLCYTVESIAKICIGFYDFWQSYGRYVVLIVHGGRIYLF